MQGNREVNLANSCTTVFDNNLKNIYGLKWMPWIGKDYATAPIGKRLLIVGESHYLYESEDETKEEVKDFFKGTHNTFPRHFINHTGLFFDSGYTHDHNNKLVRNTERALFDTNNVSNNQQRKLWHSVAYFNVVQRALDSIEERPNWQDWRDGWDIFVKVIEVLKPDYVLFCGVAVSNEVGFFKEALSKNVFASGEISKGVKIGGAFSRTGFVSKDGVVQLPLSFMRHPSKYFSWDKWGSFVSSQMPEYIEWLRKN